MYELICASLHMLRGDTTAGLGMIDGEVLEG